MYDYDFQRDKDFIKKSPTFNELLKAVKDHQYLAKQDTKLIQTSLKLWTESVLKHNLSVHMNVDPIQLITNENSNDVKKTFGKIMFKDKHSRTNEDFNVLRAHGIIHNVIMLQILYDIDKKDPYQILKTEFKAYKEDPVVTKKIKP